MHSCSIVPRWHRLSSSWITHTQTTLSNFWTAGRTNEFTCSSRTVFTDKQQLATDLAGSPRTVSPDEQWCKLVSVRHTEFHVPLGTQTFQLPQSIQDIGTIAPRAQGRSFLKQQLDGILCIQHTSTTKQHPSYNIAPCDKHSTSDQTHFDASRPLFVAPRLPSIAENRTKKTWLKLFFDAPNLHWGRQDFHQCAAQLCYSQPFVVGLGLYTPAAAARARSSSLDISDKARRSHSTPCETASTRSSSNLAANATSSSSTYSIQHTATTKQHSSYNIAPCDKHSTSDQTHFDASRPLFVAPRLPSIAENRTKKDLVKTFFLTHPTSIGGAKTFINALRSSATVSHLWLGWVCIHQPQQPGREAHLLIFPTKHDGATQHLVKQLLREVLPIWQPMQLLHHPPTASNTLPPQNNTHPTTLHHVTNIQLRIKHILTHPGLFWWHHDFQQLLRTEKTTTLVKTFFLTHPTFVGGAKTSNNWMRSSPTASHFLSGPRPTFLALAILRSSITEIPSRAPWSHWQPLVTVLLRSSCNRISTALDDAVACHNTTAPSFENKKEKIKHPRVLRHWAGWDFMGWGGPRGRH